MLNVEITKKGKQLKEQAATIPQRVAGCVNLDSQEALQLYQLLHKLLDALEGKK